MEARVAALENLLADRNAQILQVAEAAAQAAIGAVAQQNQNNHNAAERRYDVACKSP